MKKIIAAALSAALTLGAAAPQSVFAADKQYKVTFVDFDDKVITVQTVSEGQQIDYSAVNVDALQKHIDKYTEQAFASWDITPSTTDRDITIHALSKTAFISIDGVPAVTSYYSRSGKIDLFGFKAAITVTTQTPAKDANGNYITESSTIDITSSCSASPSNLKEAFYTSDQAVIDIIPLGDDKPLYSYAIKCYDYLGDVNENGSIDSVDASSVLTTYAQYATTASGSVSPEYLKRGDVNMDGLLDARDASLILSYYALSSVDSTIDWNSILS